MTPTVQHASVPQASPTTNARFEEFTTEWLNDVKVQGKLLDRVKEGSFETEDDRRQISGMPLSIWKQAG